MSRVPKTSRPPKTLTNFPQLVDTELTILLIIDIKSVQYNYRIIKQKNQTINITLQCQLHTYTEKESLSFL